MDSKELNTYSLSTEEVQKILDAFATSRASRLLKFVWSYPDKIFDDCDDIEEFDKSCPINRLKHLNIKAILNRSNNKAKI